MTSAFPQRENKIANSLFTGGLLYRYMTILWVSLKDVIQFFTSWPLEKISRWPWLVTATIAIDGTESWSRNKNYSCIQTVEIYFLFHWQILSLVLAIIRIVGRNSSGISYLNLEHSAWTDGSCNFPAMFISTTRFRVTTSMSSFVNYFRRDTACDITKTTAINGNQLMNDHVWIWCSDVPVLL